MLKKQSIPIALLAMFSLGLCGLAFGDCSGLDWVNDATVPACPAGGSLLPDTYPAMGVVISESDSSNADSRQMVLSFVEETLVAAGKRVPKVFLPGVPLSTIDDLREWINTRAPDPATKATWLHSLVQIPGTQEFQWQQDYFISMTDKTTGDPVVRPVRGYSNHLDGEDNAKRLGKAMGGACHLFGFESETIPPKAISDYTFKNANMGGNTGGMPLGKCIHGVNQEPRFGSLHYCVDSHGVDQSIAISTSWLTVGHADEVVGVIKDKTQTAPCDFAITTASPQLALDLIDPSKHPETKDQLFFAFASDPTLAKSRAWQEPTSTICDAVAAYRAKHESSPSSQPGQPDKPSSSGTSSFIWRTLENEADAGIGISRPPRPSCDFQHLTNGEVFAALQDDVAFRDYNLLVQKEMDDTEDKIRAAYKNSQCPLVKIIRMPNLFYGFRPPIERQPDEQVKVHGVLKRFGDLSDEEKATLPLYDRYPHSLNPPERNGNAVLPNPTNAVVIENTVLSPDLQNSAFSSYVKSAYRSAGMDMQTVDTWERAHVNRGNLHCSTHTLRFCRP